MPIKKDDDLSKEENINSSDEPINHDAEKVPSDVFKSTKEEKVNNDEISEIEPLPEVEVGTETINEGSASEGSISESQEEKAENTSFKLNSKEELSENAYGEVEYEIEDDEDENEDKLEKKVKRQKRTIIGLVITIIIILLLLGSCNAFLRKKANDCDSACGTDEIAELDPNQGDYAAEEVANKYVRLISMPGWGGFTIPANTITITQGFEFHNPEDNSWYEDTVSINGQEVETFIVGDSEVEINHLLRIVGIKNTVKSVKSYDENYFVSYLSADNKYIVKGIAGFDGTKEIVVELANGEEVTLDITCNHEMYYMSFALYIENGDNDILLYQSGLVEPGKYIQRMDLTSGISKGTYDAYVFCQPYKSDMKTKTNSGIVKITLTAM